MKRALLIGLLFWSLSILYSTEVKNSDIDNLFLEAAQKGRLDDVKKALNRGANINTLSEKSGVTALYYAIDRKDYDLMNYLLAHKPSPNLELIMGEGGVAEGTLLWYAMLIKNYVAVEALLKAGADPNRAIPGSGYGTAFFYLLDGHYLSERGNFRSDILELFMNYGANLDYKDEAGNTIMIYAATSDKNYELVKAICENYDFALRYVNPAGYDAYSTAENSGSYKILGLLAGYYHNDPRSSDNSKIDDLLLAAASKGELTEVKRLLSAGANINAVDQYNYSVLMKAIESKNYEMVSFLLKQKPGPIKTLVPAVSRFRGGLSYSLIANVAESGDEKMLRLLLENGVNPDDCDKGSAYTALMYLTNIPGSLPMMKLLVSYGADVNFSSGHSNVLTWLLDNLAYSDKKALYLEMLDFLMKEGADPDRQNFEGVSAYKMAYDNGLDEVVEIFDYYKKHPSKKLNYHSKLLRAVEQGKVKEVEEGIKRVPDVDIRDGKGRTLLEIAYRNNELEIAQLLVEAGADVNLRYNLGSTLLMRGLNSSGQLSLVKYLVGKGASLTYKDYEGRDLLSIARKLRLEDIADYIEFRLSLAQRDVDPTELLLRAVKNGDRDAAKLALERGADINYSTYDHYSGYSENILSIALHGDDLEMFSLLLSKKPDLNRLVSAGPGFSGTLLVAALSFDKNEMFKMLLEAGADVNKEGEYVGPPISIVSSPEELKLLIDHGADVNWVDEEGNSRVMVFTGWAEEDDYKRYYNLIKILCEEGASLTHKNRKGETVFTIAERNGVKEVIELFNRYKR